MEPEHHLIWLYLEVEALFGEVVGDHRLRSRGYSPALSDVELLTIELFCEFQGYDSDKGIWRYIRDHWLDWFPSLGSYKNFTKHSANLMSVKQLMFERLSRPSQQDNYYLVDGVPVRLCRFARAKNCKLFPQSARFGHCAAQKESYYGFKAVIVASDQGKIRAMNLVAANCDERQALLDMDLKIDGHMLADKGFLGQEFQDDLSARAQIEIHTPLRKNMKDDRPRELVKTIMNKRRYIETVIGKLCDQFSVAVVRARDKWHLSSRMFRKLIAFNLAINFFGSTKFFAES